MTVSRRSFLRLAGTAAVGLAAGSAIHWHGVRPAYAAESGTATHILNRLTWGIRLEDVAKIEQMGIPAYIDWQLEPEKIPDPFVDLFMAQVPKLGWSISELLRLPDNTLNSEVQFGLILARLIRAAASERQLYELMVEFWTDHFNVPLPSLIAAKVVEDREVIRKHALGKFRDLLFASAQSPAMLVYLNNHTNAKEHPNENYARELMELHTLGVNGGYSEADVKAVARAFTGWTVSKAPHGLFAFDERMHDTAPKTILGRTLPGGRGIEDGLQVLDMLAGHASTARFISFKLCRRFVSDTPPESLVDSTAGVFKATDGDIRKVLRHILTSAEFMAAPGQKFRRPVEFIAAVLRVTRADLKNPGVLGGPLNEMGQIPFHWLPPNGYPDVTGAWLNSNGLLIRWQSALALMAAAQAGDKGVQIPLDKLVPPMKTAGELVDRATELVLHGSIAPEDRAQLIAFVTDGQGKAESTLDARPRADKLSTLIGLLMSSPYFQWH
jgi:hypothetical protein